MEGKNSYQKYYQGRSINLLLDQDVIGRLENIKIEKGMKSRCEVIRMIIADYLKEDEKEKNDKN